MSQTSGNKVGLMMLGFFLAFGMVLTALILSGTIEKVKLSNQTIRVKGYAEMEIKSDLGIWRGSFSAFSPILTGAYDKLESDLSKILTYLESHGIKRDVVDVSSVNTFVRYKYNEKGIRTNIRLGYSLNQTITVKSDNVELIKKISNESTSLIREGVELESYSPDYYFTKINDLKIEMLGKATRDAKLRAEQLASNSDSEVGKLRSATQGVFQITPLHSTEISDYGRYDLGTIDKSIKAVVTIDYSIK